MSEYGEPWARDDHGNDPGWFADLLDKDRRHVVEGDEGGNTYWPEHERLPRIVACVNALQGMNPEAVAGVVEALEMAVSHWVAVEDGYNPSPWDHVKQGQAALAALNENQSQPE